MKTKLGILLLFFALAGRTETFAQKIGYIDTDYILGQMPEYAEAQKQVDELASSWQKEISNKMKEIEGLYDVLKSEEVLLTAEMLEERRKLIQAKEDSVQSYQKKVFSSGGLYFLKKKELISPVLDLVFTATKKVCQKHKLDFMFDKSGDLVMIYTNPVHDYTDYVLEALGLGDEVDTVK
ncbi:MAG: OmpH family outer membrane protein [Cytophagales bacterium]|nr:OmpH family outer membrane protein [Cytophagales bacterium]